MNFSQKLGLFVIILISVLYVYFSYFNKDFEWKIPNFNQEETQIPTYNPVENNDVEEPTVKPAVKPANKNVKIFLLDKSGNLRAVNRVCVTGKNSSCFIYAIEELLKAPSKDEKSKGLTSEIPGSTKLLSVRESSGNILIDLSSDFETGGGAESTYMRVKQLIRTVNANSTTPVYLYINGSQADVIGGEGIMIKQPLNEGSLDG